MSSYLWAPARHEKGIAGEWGAVQHAPCMLQKVIKPLGTSSTSTAGFTARAGPSPLFLTFLARRQELKVRFGKHCGFFTIRSSGPATGTLALKVSMRQHVFAAHGAGVPHMLR